MNTVAESAATIQCDPTWMAAVRRVSELAQARLPDALHGRVQRATATWYSANGACPDHQRAPEHLCKHRLARGIYLRAGELLREGLPLAATTLDPDTSTPTAGDHGHADEPVTTIPPQFITHIQGKPFVKFAGLLQLAHAKGLQELRATWTANEPGLSLARAVAVFPFGRFEEAGDATPDNVTRMVASHFRRVALTRAKARALRDALGIDLCAVEELGEA